ncbi:MULTISPECIES: hypothetical protein [Alteromonas]|jgi:hypothetical protein|uniref:hypothetical protein n=1 Tax=Alteromonas TaxID=226 RepID=UPI001653546A|nr:MULTISPECIES: hypothetical protein [Alteromonas]MBC6985626.1 hypothetical protein [Alteromonas sp. BZK5]MCG7644720.1 hypothetical protein [Alteromonas sp. Cnat3-28]|tara:strand:+ start:743 stop:1072 length:330 start_codon:yes stop_codon:yes gene_type:complete
METLSTFAKRKCCLVKEHPDHESPTSKDVKDLLYLNNWTYADAAKLTGVAVTAKGSSPTVQRWCTKESSSDHRDIPYSAWLVLLTYSSLVICNMKQANKIINGKLTSGN